MIEKSLVHDLFYHGVHIVSLMQGKPTTTTQKAQRRGL
jgi:hypothetical protein